MPIKSSKVISVIQRSSSHSIILSVKASLEMVELHGIATLVVKTKNQDYSPLHHFICQLSDMHTEKDVSSNQCAHKEMGRNELCICVHSTLEYVGVKKTQRDTCV